MNKRLVDQDGEEVMRNAVYSHARFWQLRAERSRLEDEYKRKERLVGDTSKKRRSSSAANELWAIKQAMYLNQLELTHWQQRYAVFSAELVHRGIDTWSTLTKRLEEITHEW